MAKLSEEAKKAIAEFGAALVATASKDGKPNVSLKGSFRVLDDGFWMMSMSSSLTLLRHGLWLT